MILILIQILLFVEVTLILKQAVAIQLNNTHFEMAKVTVEM